MLALMRERRLLSFPTRKYGFWFIQTISSVSNDKAMDK